MDSTDIVSALQQELTDPRYADLTPSEVVEDMRANTSDAPEYLVSLAAIEATLRTYVVEGKGRSVWADLRASAATDPLADEAFDMLTSNRLENLDVKLEFVQGVFLQLVQAGYADDPVIAYISSLPEKTVNRGQVLFGRLPTAFEVFAAMAD